jgi:DNA modification methylase
VTDYRLLEGDVLDALRALEPSSIDLVVTSPPYAEQRSAQYGGISEDDFPRWCVQWFGALRPALRPTASIMVNIRPHLRRGEIADYMLRTRLELRSSGWLELEELIWHKPDAPPLGSPARPRRAWESIHWFASTPEPWTDLTKNGTYPARTGLAGGRGQRDGYVSTSGAVSSGRSRQTDVLIAPAGAGIDRSEWNDHPAQYPTAVPAWCIALACPPGGTVLDPFVGSGTTGVAALELGRDFVGIDRDPHYLEIADRRLRTVEPSLFDEEPSVEILELFDSRGRL